MSQPGGPVGKIFKKGDLIFREGEKAQKIYLIQAGLVSVFLPRAKKNVEIYQASTSQVLGEEALFGATQYSSSAVALNDTQIVEIGLDQIRPQIEQGSQVVKLLFRSMAEKQKSTNNELKSFKMERDTTPCPPDHVAKVFGVIYHVAKHIGTQTGDKVTVEWTAFKKYGQRIFLESPLRMEQACNILVKLKHAEYQMVKNDTDPEAPEEIGFIHIQDLSPLEEFFEFYQNYHFKGEGASVLKSDDKCIQLAQAMIELSKDEKIDRAGVVYMNYKDVLDRLKDMMGNAFSADLFDRLEQKGLFVKRESSQKGGQISFFRSEFGVMHRNWKILREVEKWNEKGFVEIMEAPEKPAAGGAAQAAAGTKVCPACSAQASEAQKFCGECGHSFSVKKAA